PILSTDRRRRPPGPAAAEPRGGGAARGRRLHLCAVERGPARLGGPGGLGGDRARAARATTLDIDGAARCAEWRAPPPRSFPGRGDAAGWQLAAGLPAVVCAHHPRAGHRAARGLRQRSSGLHRSGGIVRVEIAIAAYCVIARRGLASGRPWMDVAAWAVTAPCILLD